MRDSQMTGDFSPLDSLFAQESSSVNPGAFPNEMFLHYSLPAFDQCGGPVVDYGIDIESNKTLLQRDSILVSKLNPRKPRVQLARKSADLRQVSSTEFIVLVPRSDRSDLEYFKHLLRSNSVQGKLDAVATGTTNSHVRARPRDLLKQRVFAPGMTEQRRIAEILSALDDQIRATEQIIAKLTLARVGILRDLLTRGINERGHLRDPAADPEEFQDSPLGLLPIGWVISSIDRACVLVVDCPHSTPVFRDAGVLVARTSNIRDGAFSAVSASYVSEAEYMVRISRAEPTAGDIVFTREAPVGEAFVIPAGMRICLGQRVMLLRPRANTLLSGYLLAQLYSGFVRERIDLLTAGTTNPHLNVLEVKRFTIPLPDIREQSRIVASIDSHNARVQGESARLNKLRTLKSGLMADMLTGLVRVPVGAAS